jgi:hypothetical protein
MIDNGKNICRLSYIILAIVQLITFVTKTDGGWVDLHNVQEWMS